MLKILMVDDEDHLDILIRQKFRNEIESGEFFFYFAKNGKYALDVLDSYPDISVVISDINMPEMDGISLMRVLQRDYPNVHIALMSAYGDLEGIGDAIKNGNYDFISKPIDLDELYSFLKKCALDITPKASEVCKLRDRVAEIKDELKVAYQLQKSSLPNDFFDRDDFQLYAYMHPTQNISGDFYDFFWIDSNRLGVVIADVSGKGASAALFMAMCRNLIKVTAVSSPDPASAFSKVNEYLLRENPDMMFIAAFYGILNIKNGEFEYTVAGHVPPLIFGASEKCRDLVVPDSLVMGVDRSYKYRNRKITLAVGQGLFFFTDGVLDVHGPNGEIFGKERLMTIVNDRANESADVMVKKVEEYINNFVDCADNKDIYDDVTCMAIKFKPMGNKVS